MPYITDQALLESVANRLGTTPAELVDGAAYWNEIVETANAEAYSEIRGVLVGRGYTVATIDEWDRRAEFNRKIAVCHALTEGALKREISFEALDRVCKCREELATVIVTVDGEEAETSSSGANIGYGDMERTDDVFTADMDL